MVKLLSKDEEFKHETELTYDLTSKQFLLAKDLKVKSIKQLRQKTDYGSTLEVIYDLTNSGLTYQTGSNLAIFPQNSEENVNECAQILGLDLDQNIAFVPNNQSPKKGTTKHPFPTPCSVKEAL
jgi:NADPH-ferrihemoprotein reductase